MNENELLKRIAIAKLKPDSVSDLQPKELADLVLVVLEYVKQVNKAIQDGKIRGEKGESGVTPKPDQDYLSITTATREINNVLSEAIAEIESKTDKAISKIKNGRDGKDAVVTSEQIQQAARLAFDLIELPDFKTLITQEPDAIRNSLELLQGEERLDVSAIKGLDEVISEVKNSSKKFGVGGIRFLSQLVDVHTTNLANNDVLKWNSTTLRWENAQESGGGGASAFTDLTDAPNSYTGQSQKFVKVKSDETGLEFVAGSGVSTEWGDITGTLSDQTDLQSALDGKADTGDLHSPVTVTDSSEIDLTLTGQNITASLIAGSIDESKLDASVNASLDLADSAVQDLADLGITASSTELNYVDGVTSAIQTQLDGKAASLGADDNYVTDAEKTKLSNLSGTNTGDQFLFHTIQVDGQDAIQADNVLDTLNIVRGTGIDITVSDSTDTMTIGIASNVYRQGGTDVAVADGGTGASTAAGALTNLGLTAIASELNILDGATLSTTELNYVDGVTSAIQPQIDSKQYKISLTVGPTGSNADYVCDGTDDEVQINQAITDANTAGGGIVYILSGTYVTAANVVHKSNVIVRGEGYSTNVTFPVNATYWFLENVDNTKIENMRVDGSGQTTTGFAGSRRVIHPRGVRNLEISGCYVYATDFGIFTTSYISMLTDGVWIHNNYIEGKCGNDLIGGGPLSSDSEECRNVIVRDNFIHQNYTASGAGTYYTAMDMVGCKRVRFIDNTVSGNVIFGHEKDPHEHSIMRGNIVFPPLNSTDVAVCIHIQDSSLATNVSGKLTVEGNHVYGGWILMEGKSDQRIKYAVLANNTVHNNMSFTNDGHLDVFQKGIVLKYADYCTVNGNVLLCNNGDNNDETGIRIESSSNNHIYGNIIDDYYLGIFELGTTSGNNIHDNYITNCVSPITSSTLSASRCYNNVGSDPVGLYAQGNVTGATSFDRVNGDVITATLTGNITVTLPSTYTPYGAKLKLILTQDATGSRTATWPSNFKKAGGTLTLTTTASAVDVIDLAFDGTNWREVSRAMNMS